MPLKIFPSKFPPPENRVSEKLSSKHRSSDFVGNKRIRRKARIRTSELSLSYALTNELVDEFKKFWRSVGTDNFVMKFSLNYKYRDFDVAFKGGIEIEPLTFNHSRVSFSVITKKPLRITAFEYDLERLGPFIITEWDLVDRLHQLMNIELPRIFNGYK